ncbi:MAG: hypothetical protein KatS3mg121_0485 [Gammaproteobacteria bacterium]|nr:MAG: hypothetical protein KatS3mg121_0485 [Gammaproteobacteria bacterium]
MKGRSTNPLKKPEEAFRAKEGFPFIVKAKTASIASDIAKGYDIDSAALLAIFNRFAVGLVALSEAFNNMRLALQQEVAQGNDCKRCLSQRIMDMALLFAVDPGPEREARMPTWVSIYRELVENLKSES